MFRRKAMFRSSYVPSYGSYAFFEKGGHMAHRPAPTFDISVSNQGRFLNSLESRTCPHDIFTTQQSDQATMCRSS